MMDLTTSPAMFADKGKGVASQAEPNPMGSSKRTAKRRAISGGRRKAPAYFGYEKSTMGEDQTQALRPFVGACPNFGDHRPEISFFYEPQLPFFDAKYEEAMATLYEAPTTGQVVENEQWIVESGHSGPAGGAHETEGLETLDQQFETNLMDEKALKRWGKQKAEGPHLPPEPAQSGAPLDMPGEQMDWQTDAIIKGLFAAGDMCCVGTEFETGVHVWATGGAAAILVSGLRSAGAR